MKKALFLLLAFTLLCGPLKSQVYKADLGGASWEFRRMGSEQWYPASVPGCVHTDLMANGLIPDPFYASNEKLVQWVDTCDWEYRLVFMADEKLLAHEHISLVFYGLDTYADIYLNGSLLQKSENMFVSWELECKDKLQKGDNELRIEFLSVSRESKKSYRALPRPLPYDERVAVRKAQYQFGWDWGPRLISMGIWKPVEIIGWDQLKIRDVHFTQLQLDERSAKLKFLVKYEALKAGKCTARLYNGGELMQSVKVRPVDELNELEFLVDLKKPELWWPNGMGKQKLYDFMLRIETASGKFDEKNLKIGLRTLELVQDTDSIGRSFYFKVNGRALFAKGANYIPLDAFPSRIDSVRTARLIQDAVDCHMNMLRIWGGGIYESDDFYEKCDAKGILIWQDFMFACAMYPGDLPFQIWTKLEVQEQVMRLRNHPSLALWCGNNEIDEGWNNWGMQQQFGYDSIDSNRIWRDYLGLFEGIIPETLHKGDRTRPYHPSSPTNGWGRKESMTEGDAHYWGVWWGNEAFEVYESKIPRFMSEYGFQGFPDLNSLNSVVPKEERILFSDALKTHEKHPRGFELISDAMQRDYWLPDDYEKYALLSQFVQARGMQKAIEAHRRSRPYCMGSLYWQLNDCWPVISWSGIDYYGRWKAAQYQVKRSYSEVILSAITKNGKLNIYGISDLANDSLTDLKVKVFSNTGTPIYSKILNSVLLRSNASTLLYSFDPMQIPSLDTTRSFLYVEIGNSGHILANIQQMLCKPKNYQQAEFQGDMQVTAIDSLSYEISIRSDVPVFGLFIRSSDPDIRYSDNFFNLMPGNEATRIMAVGKKDQTFTLHSLWELR
jgi:beta-mannosidase